MQGEALNGKEGIVIHSSLQRWEKMYLSCFRRNPTSYAPFSFIHGDIVLREIHVINGDTGFEDVKLRHS